MGQEKMSELVRCIYLLQGLNCVARAVFVRNKVERCLTQRVSVFMGVLLRNKVEWFLI